MKRRSPTLEGFQVMFRQPSLGLAEIAWRWSFGLAVSALLLLSFREYLATLPVTAAEMLLLRTRQPPLILQAIARILQGSAPRAVAALMVLTLFLTLAWIVLASIGRCASLTTLVEHFSGSEGKGSWRLNSLMGLNFFRAAAVLAAIVGSFGAILLAGAASPRENPSPGSALLIFWMLTLFIVLAWSALNWFLSLAAIFVVADGKKTFAALAAAADLCWQRPGSVAAVATWFGLTHLMVFVVASSVAAFPLAFAGVLPGGVVLGGLLLVTLLYFAIVDFLHVGRLAAYVCMVSQTEERPEALPLQSEDDILSDIPGLVPPPEPITS